MKPQDIIADARYTINDSTVPYRQEGAELLRYVNAGIKEISVLRPDLFMSVQIQQCTVGSTQQGVTFADAARLLKVLRIHNGPSVPLMDVDTLELFNPSWRLDDPGPAQGWAPMGADPLQFEIYPRSPVGQYLHVQFVRNPKDYAIDEDIVELPDSMRPALVDYVVHRVESKDDEHVLSERAGMAYANFKTKIGVGNATV